MRVIRGDYHGFRDKRRLLWPGYIVAMCLLSALCFGGVKDLLLDVHDRETFQDNIAIDEDFTFFFSAEKKQPSGRPLAELFKFFAYKIRGNDPGFFHLLVVMFHGMAAVLLARVSWRMGANLRLSLASGLLFLVNVAHFQAVHHISGTVDYPLALSLGSVRLSQQQVSPIGLRYLDTLDGRWLAGLYTGLIGSARWHTWVVYSGDGSAAFGVYWSWIKGHDLKATIRHLLPEPDGFSADVLIGLLALGTRPWKPFGTI